MNAKKLQQQYEALRPTASRLASSLAPELSQLLEREGIPLAVPLEWRVKSWQSISEKMERRDLIVDDIEKLTDLVGIRFILLYRRHVDTIDKILGQTLDILSRDDMATRLGDNQFGYQSVHYLAKLPPAWLKVPSFSGCKNLVVEIQVRTIAQHMWAAVSHQLQYKTESSVPAPVRRAINRVSALLETVDLEFERVLTERAAYVKATADAEDAELNADTLARFLNDTLPPANRRPDEPVAMLLPELASKGITTVRELHALCDRHLKAVLAEEAEIVAHIRAGNEPIVKREGNATTTMTYNVDPARDDKGVFFAHIGLVRSMLNRDH